MKPREWKSTEIFSKVNFGDDIGLPDTFVDFSAYEQLQAKLDEAVKALEKTQVNLQDHVDADKENRCSYYDIGDALSDIKQVLQKIRGEE